MLLKGTPVAQFPLFTYVQITLGGKQGYSLLAAFDEKIYRLHGSLLIVDHYLVANHLLGYPVKKDQWNPLIGNLPQVIKIIFILCFRRKCHDKSINASVGQHFHIYHLLVEGFIRNTHDNIVPALIGIFLYSAKHRGKEMVDNVRDDHPDIACTLVLEADCNIVRLVIIESGKGLDLLAGIPADFIAVFQCFRNCRDGNFQFPCYILKGDFFSNHPKPGLVNT